MRHRRDHLKYAEKTFISPSRALARTAAHVPIPDYHYANERLGLDRLSEYGVVNVPREKRKPSERLFEPGEAPLDISATPAARVWAREVHFDSDDRQWRAIQAAFGR